MLNEQDDKDMLEMFARGQAIRYDARHGGPYDRGCADKNYGRKFDPHYYKGDSYFSERVSNLTPDEVMAYRTGYFETDKED